MKEIIKNEKTEREENKMIKLDLIQSRRFGRICYGFARDENWLVYVKEDEAKVVKQCFLWQLMVIVYKTFKANCLIKA